MAGKNVVIIGAGLTNFCMAGQWMSSGGGVVPSLYSGRHAIQLLRHNKK